MLKQGDGGKDIVVYDKGLVYACHAPERLKKDWKESEVIKKMESDFNRARTTVSTGLKEWIFVHNHPASALSNKISERALQIRASNPTLRLLEVWGIEQLWENIPERFKGKSEGQIVIERSLEIAAKGDRVGALEILENALPMIRNMQDINSEVKVLVQMSYFSSKVCLLSRICG